MGNRAVIIFTGGGLTSPGVYLHWNGGAESIDQFLGQLAETMPAALGEPARCAARFAQIVGNFFDEGAQPETRGLSVALMNRTDVLDPAELTRLDPGDNGVYVVAWNRTAGFSYQRWSDGRWID
jgi:hypothetical protein